MQWTPSVNQPGFYRARVTLEGAAGKIVERQLTLAVIEPGRRIPHGEFGWCLPAGDHQLPYPVLNQLLPQMGINWAKYPVWTGDKEADKLDQLIDFAERLSMQGIESVGLLAEPPAEERADLATAQR